MRFILVSFMYYISHMQRPASVCKVSVVALKRLKSESCVRTGVVGSTRGTHVLDATVSTAVLIAIVSTARPAPNGFTSLAPLLMKRFQRTASPQIAGTRGFAEHTSDSRRETQDGGDVGPIVRSLFIIGVRRHRYLPRTVRRADSAS